VKVQGVRFEIGRAFIGHDAPPGWLRRVLAHPASLDKRA
jgi:hypothetical protein